MPVKEAQPGGQAGPDVESALARDLYLLAPLKLPRGQQYAVGASDGQLLFLVKRTGGGRGAFAFGSSAAAALIVLGFLSSVGDSLGGPALKWAATAAGAVLGFLLAMTMYPALLGERSASFGAREKPNEKVLDIKQAERSRPFESTFTITGARGRLLGTVRRNYLRTLFRTRWTLYGAAGEPIARADEASVPRAIATRVVGWAVPSVRSNFIVSSAGGASLALLERMQPVQGRVVLDLRLGGRDGIDRSLGLALGVLIDLSQR